MIKFLYLYFLVTNDKVTVYCPHTSGYSNAKSVAYIGSIEFVGLNNIIHKFHQDFKPDQKTVYKIVYRPSRTSYNQQQHVIGQFKKENNIGFLFPAHLEMPLKTPQMEANLSDNGEMTISGKNVNWYNQNLNIYQKRAIVNILRGETRPCPYVIYGPPGLYKEIIF